MYIARGRNCQATKSCTVMSIFSKCLQSGEWGRGYNHGTIECHFESVAGSTYDSHLIIILFYGSQVVRLLYSVWPLMELSRGCRSACTYTVIII